MPDDNTGSRTLPQRNPDYPETGGKQDMIQVIPLGGLGEIGLNMMVVQIGEEMIIIDAGMMFPEDYMLGVDVVIPEMTFIRENRARITGIFLTHSHEDHIGALPYLIREVNVPIHGTPFTIGMVRHRLEEHDLHHTVLLREVRPGTTFTLGAFTLEVIRVCHSVVDGVAYALKTPYGHLVHTGDFRIGYDVGGGHATDVSTFARLGEEGVMALLSDSTNVEKEGYTVPEKDIARNLRQIFANSPGRIIVALFASSINRMQQVVDIAASKGRKIAISGRSIEVSVGIAGRLGYLDIPESVGVDLEAVAALPPHQIVILTTGSQGEPMSALARMVSGTHKQIRIRSGDTVILSSRFIPGNEKAIAHIINNLYRQGANVVYDKIAPVHVSGHAYQEELKLMMTLTRPRYFMPIHGEYRHLVLHARLAKEMGIPEENVLLAENGDIVAFDAGGAGICGKARTGRIMVDGKGIGDVGRCILNERRALSEDGFVAVTIGFDEETGVVIYGPEITSRGFVFENETGHLLDDAICVILEIVEDIPPDIADRYRRIQSRIKGDLRNYFNFTIKRRPVILPFVLAV